MLQPTPWELLERLNAVHGSRGVLEGRDARLGNPVLRAAYAVRHRDFNLSSYSSGRLGEPCARCATFTNCFCEVCFLHPRDPPFPICTQCDGEHYVCVLCESNGVPWSAGGEARTARGDPEEMLEISAFRDENGEVVRINPPLRIPISQVTDEQPVDAHLEAYLRAHGM